MRLLVSALVLLGEVFLGAPGHAMPARDVTEPPMPCDPGFGAPEPIPTCPDERPLIGEVTSYDGVAVMLQPLHVYWGDEGRAYAEARGLDFSNDYLQVPEGAPVEVVLEPDTVCTAAIRVHQSRSYFADHVVECRLFGRPVRQYPVTSALWFRDGLLLQLSELYRP